MKMPVEDRREGVPQGGRTLKLQEKSELARKEREGGKIWMGSIVLQGNQEGSLSQRCPWKFCSSQEWAWPRTAAMLSQWLKAACRKHDLGTDGVMTPEG